MSAKNGSISNNDPSLVSLEGELISKIPSPG